MNNAYPYIVRPLPPDSPLYIQRDADAEVIRLVERMEYVQLSEPRQQGKTSLIFQARDRLNSSARMVVYIDVAALKVTTEADWYRDLTEQLIQQLHNILKVEHLRSVPVDASSWRSFLLQLMATRTRQHSNIAPQIIIALDGVEYIPAAWATPFFRVLRQVYTTRSIEADFKRLSFILSGSFNPKQLTTDMLSSPFNIASRVDLKDFDLEQVSRLLSLFSFSNKEIGMRDAIADRIHYWTDGQPYLTQWLCSQLATERATPTTTDLVDKAVGNLLQGNDDHLLRISRALKQEPALQQYLDTLISQPKPFAPSPEVNPQQFQLVHIYGLLKSDMQGTCRIRNRVYELWLKKGPTWQEWERHITEQLKIGGEITPQNSLIPDFFWRSVVDYYKRSHPEHLGKQKD